MKFFARKQMQEKIIYFDLIDQIIILTKPNIYSSHVQS